MEIQQLASKLSDAKFELQLAHSHGAMVNQRKEGLRNILENNLDEILRALDFAAKAEEKIKVLEIEVQDADDELDEKDDEIKELKEQLAALQTKAPARKGKSKGGE